MPVIVFQAMIVLSLIIVRLFSKRHLALVSGVWSAFTLIIVFMPWLMALQLAVIWAAYFVLRPGTKLNGKDAPNDAP